jgi:hypothetical protein
LSRWRPRETGRDAPPEELGARVAHRPRARPALVGAAVAIVVVVGIVAWRVMRLADPGNGAFPRPIGGTETCVPGRTFTMGAIDLSNPTRQPLRFTSLSLVDDHHLRVLGVEFVPIVSGRNGGYDLIGWTLSWPPAPTSIPRDALWRDRRVLPFVMPPSTRGQVWNLVVGLRVVGGLVGSTEQVVMRYFFEGHRYVWQSGATLVLVASKRLSCTTPSVVALGNKLGALVIRSE